jgi:hypothetical protein
MVILMMMGDDDDDDDGPLIATSGKRSIYTT